MFSMIQALINDPLWFLEYSLYRIPAVLIALILHEWAHGYMAYRLGDPTAKEMGRLSLNPLKHLDPLGTVLMFFLGFGWAKPVPINPNNFKKPRRDDLLVSVAGIAMNLLLFLLFTTASVLLNNLLWRQEVLDYYTLREMMGLKDGYINYILAGYGKDWADLYARPELLWAVRLTSQIAMVNVYIALFNLIPIPPLDGSHVLNDLVLKGNLFAKRQTAQIGMALVLILSFTGLLGDGLTFLADGLQGGVLYVVGLLLGIT